MIYQKQINRNLDADELRSLTGRKENIVHINTPFLEKEDELYANWLACPDHATINYMVKPSVSYMVIHVISIKGSFNTNTLRLWNFLQLSTALFIMPMDIHNQKVDTIGNTRIALSNSRQACLHSFATAGQTKPPWKQEALSRCLLADEFHCWTDQAYVHIFHGHKKKNAQLANNHKGHCDWLCS